MKAYSSYSSLVDCVIKESFPRPGLSPEESTEIGQSGDKRVCASVYVSTSDQGLSTYLKELLCQALSTAGQKASNKRPACEQTIQWHCAGWEGEGWVGTGSRVSQKASHPAARSHPPPLCPGNKRQHNLNLKSVFLCERGPQKPLTHNPSTLLIREI